MGNRILLADDSITIQKVVNLTFADEGIEVVAVSNGDLAERRLGEINPDLVLADIFMPGKNGYQLCEAIKQDPQFQNVPVVLLVGAFEPFDQAEARRVRADAHLTKPFESRTLVETVRRLVGENSGDRPKSIFKMAEPPEERAEVQDQSPALAFTATTAAKLDLSAMMADSVQPVILHSEIGEELLSPAPDHAVDEFEVGPLNAPLQETVTVLTDRVDPFDLIEVSPGNGFATETQSPFDLYTRETFLDFDRADSLESSSAHNLVSSEASTAMDDVNLDAGGDIRSLVTESPPLADLATSSETRFVGSDVGIEAEHSTLLAADEPLGDVLFDEATHVERFSLDQTSEAGHSQFDLVSEEATDRDWTSPRPGAYSTAQLDSIEMPADAAQYVATNSQESDTKAAKDAPPPSLANTGIWSEEEARFTPIDIEAVAIEETDLQTDRAGDARSLTTEGLPSPAIEEIVRQVVAQISDSVVREVAWEVVPDCVERVIERLTRESLSKRM
jgi:CheY-like chemotaxis protein